jgi:hypothetical protein
MADVFVKDPQSTLDYKFDWTGWLAEDTISSAVVTVPTGLTSSGSSIIGKTVVVWLAGGTVEQNYIVTCNITTAAGRIDERSMIIQCADK